MKQYKALKPIARFKVGDFVGGFSEAEIKKHVLAGNIAEVKTTSTTASRGAKTNGEK